ncbi:MAG: gamma-glutamyltransferase [Rickettsiales bacterium]|nr:gamma-glutamyltransferase [Rickettsiales bacterium]
MKYIITHILLKDAMKHNLPHGDNYGSINTNMVGFNAAVVTNHWMASSVGRDILMKGGNAFDAACGISFILGVVEPQMSGIGGDGFIMMYDSKKDKVNVINATGPAPEFSYKIGDKIPIKGISSASVPGLVSGVLKMHKLKGSLSLQECLAPAIEAASNGIALSQDQSASLKSDSKAENFQSSLKIWGDKKKGLKNFGDRVVNKDLAETLKLISIEGEDGFYRGKIADKIVKISEENDGLFSINDFKNFDAEIQDPISTSYRGYDVYEAPPNSSGITLLQQLNIIENFSQKDLSPFSKSAMHLMVEAKRLAFYDRERYLADPKFFDVPVDLMLDKNYAKELSNKININGPRISNKELEINYKPDRVGDTTYFCVVDKEGNSVSQLQSIQTQWGSGMVIEGTGILMNNRMSYWHLDKNHINYLIPGKRVRHTMNPVMVFKSNGSINKLFLVNGTPGADTQVQTNMQVLSSIIDHNFLVGEAVSMPRWTHFQNLTESTIPHSTSEFISLESRFSDEIVKNIEKIGHQINIVGPWEGSGSEGMISISESGLIGAAVDPRRDGQALVW